VILKRFILKLIENRFGAGEMVVLNALNNREWDFRTEGGIEEETGLDKDRIESIIESNPTLIHTTDDGYYYIENDVSVCLALKKNDGHFLTAEKIAQSIGLSEASVRAIIDEILEKSSDLIEQGKQGSKDVYRLKTQDEILLSKRKSSGIIREQKMPEENTTIEAVQAATDELDRWIGQIVSVFNYLEAHREQMNFEDAILVLFQLQAQFTSKDKVYLQDKRLTRMISGQCPDFVKYGQSMGKIQATINSENTSEECKTILGKIKEEFAHTEDLVHQIKYDQSCSDPATGNINARRAIQILNDRRQHLHKVASETLASLDSIKKEMDSRITTSKAVRLWQVGGFWLFAFSIVFGAIFVLVTHSAEWWHLTLALIGLEVLLVLLGAFTLRTVGDLSEKNLLSLIGTAFREQFKVFTVIKGLLSTLAPTKAEAPNSNDGPKTT
jgi:hypothetical protein